MKIKVGRYSIVIRAENDTEEAYLEDTLGCSKSAPKVEIDTAFGTDRIIGLTIKKAT